MDLQKNKDAVKFQNGIQDFMIAIETFLEAMPIYRLFPTPFYRKAKRDYLMLRDLAMKYLELNRENIRKIVMEGGSIEGLSLIEQWMIEGKMSEEQCITSALDMFLAAVDTVSES